MGYFKSADELRDIARKSAVIWQSFKANLRITFQKELIEAAEQGLYIKKFNLSQEQCCDDPNFCRVYESLADELRQIGFFVEITYKDKCIDQVIVDWSGPF